MAGRSKLLSSSPLTCIRHSPPGLQAEQAQLNAEAASERQRAEFQERLAAAQQAADEATAARAAADAAADALRRDLSTAQSELQAAGQRYSAQEAALRGALEASQAGVRELEAQVSAAQRQLAARARKGGVSVEASKKAAAAASAAGQLKRENRALQAQVEGLQEQVGAAGRLEGACTAAKLLLHLVLLPSSETPHRPLVPVRCRHPRRRACCSSMCGRARSSCARPGSWLRWRSAQLATRVGGLVGGRRAGWLAGSRPSANAGHWPSTWLTRLAALYVS